MRRIARPLLWSLLLLSLVVSLARGESLFLPTARDINWHHPFARGLVGWWVVLPYLAGGPTWFATGTPYHGVLTSMGAGAGWQASPRSGVTGDMRCDGVGSISVGQVAAYDFSDVTFTVTFWLDKAASTGGQAYQVAKRSSAGSGGYFIRTATTGALTARLMDASTNIAAQRTSASAILYDGGRHHVAVVFTTDTTVLANNDLSIYIDGLLDQGARIDNGAGAYTPCTFCPLTFGSVSDGGSVLLGNLNDMRLYRRGLSAAEIWMLAKVSTPPFFSGLMEPPDLALLQGGGTVGQIKHKVIIR